MESKKRRTQRPKKAIYYLVPAWLLLFLCMSRSQVAESASSAPSVQVIAHRAGAALAPENTLAALENAIRIGADIAEIDVQMSKDGVLLAMHDKSLERTTGLCCSTWEADWAILQAADAGALYSADYVGERIPTLEALLNAARGQIPLMIEIKCTGHEQGILEKVVQLIQAAGMERECILGCADIDILRQSKTLAPALETVYIGSVRDDALYGLDFIDSYSLPVKSLTRDAVAQAKTKGKKIYTWTVDTASEIRKALALGVDGLVTDDPPLAMELLHTQVGDSK